MRLLFIKIFGGSIRYPEGDDLAGEINIWYRGWIFIQLNTIKFRTWRWFTLKRYSLKIFLIKLSDKI